MIVNCTYRLPVTHQVAESRQLGEDDLVVRLGLTQAYGAAAECSDASSGARNQAGPAQKRARIPLETRSFKAGWSEP